MKFLGGLGCQAVGCRSGSGLAIIAAHDGTETILVKLCLVCRLALLTDGETTMRRVRGATTKQLHILPNGDHALFPDVCPCCNGKGCPDGAGFGRHCQHRQETQAELFTQIEVA